MLELISQQLENNIKELSISLEDYKTASDMDEGDTVDPEDFSQQSEKKEMQYSMQIQLDNARAGLSRLNEFSGKQFSVAKSGALIETEKNWIFLGLAFPGLKVGDKELLGVSPESPAYTVINGKSKGDSFKLGNNNFTILNIY